MAPSPDDRKVRIVEGMTTGKEKLKCLEGREGKFVLVPLRPLKFPYGIPVE
jgi:hypothetical protein